MNRFPLSIVRNSSRRSRVLRELVFPALVLCMVGSNVRAQLDEETVVIEGVVENFGWTNPSAYIDVVVEEPEGGGTTTWTVWIESPADWAGYQGWSRDSVIRGDEVEVSGTIVRDIELRELLADSLRVDGGPSLRSQVTFDSAEVRPELNRTRLSAAEALTGSWLPIGLNLSSSVVFGFSLFEPDHLLNEAGRARLTELESLAPTQAQNVNDLAECIPFSPPLSMTVSGIKGFETRGEDIVIRDASIGNVQRVVHMSETTFSVDDLDRQGHSMGRWEGDALVVETVFNTRLVTDVVGVPLSPASRLVERFEVTQDRSMLKYTFAVESPDYLIMPFTPQSRGWAWTFQPDVEVPRLECDPEVARRFGIAAQQGLGRAQGVLRFLLERR